jgi:hypothetical protein
MAGKEHLVKLRWSNERDNAVEFEANDPASFLDQGASALRSLRMLTERRVHRGEIGRTVSWYSPAALHVYDDFSDRGWTNPGRIKGTETETHPDQISVAEISAAAPLVYFEPVRISPPGHEADDITGMHRQDAAWLAANVERIWSAVVDTRTWIMALTTQVMSLDDELRRWG